MRIAVAVALHLVATAALVEPLAAQSYGNSRDRLDLGGGFIEYLFRDRAGPQVVPSPQYQRDPRPIYGAPESRPLYGAPDPRALYANTDPDPSISEPEAEAPRSFKLDPRYARQEVDYDGDEAPGTIIIDTPNKFLFMVEGDGKAIRYGIGVGRPGFTWSGTHKVTSKREWPDWYPPEEMLKRQPYLPAHMAGGPNNPLGARALYLGSTLYRIHGSNEPWTIGQNVSSGCIRMRNQDVIDLYNRVKVGTKVVVI